ncbi:hypothetical protein KEM56_000993, partial [Ascosphaera pollenicola]
GTPEALALVSQHSNSNSNSSTAHPAEPTSDTEKTEALRRAKDLVRLHADMKARMSRPVDAQNQTGAGAGKGGVNVDADLMRLRGEVRRVREMLAAGGGA